MIRSEIKLNKPEFVISLPSSSDRSIGTWERIQSSLGSTTTVCLKFSKYHCRFALQRNDALLAYFYFAAISRRQRSRQKVLNRARRIDNLRNGGIPLSKGRCSRWMLYICLKFRKSSGLNQFPQFFALEPQQGTHQILRRFRSKHEQKISFVTRTGYTYFIISGTFFTCQVLFIFDRFSSSFKKRIRLSYDNFLAGVVKFSLDLVQSQQVRLWVEFGADGS